MKPNPEIQSNAYSSLAYALPVGPERCRVVGLRHPAARNVGVESPEDHGGAFFRAKSSLVLVPVTATNRRGVAITDLRRDEFSLRADDRTQEIAAVYRDDDPSVIGVVLDISGSVEGQIAREKQAVRAFLSRAEAGDEFFLVTV